MTKSLIDAKVSTNNDKYYNVEINEVYSLLDCNENGISQEEAISRLNKYGPNELKAENKESPWKLFFAQFNSLLIYILIASAVISIFLGKVVEPIAIITIVILAGVLGFIQEFQAGKAIDSLKKMASSFARVLRNGNEIQIPATELVPGDIIFLNSGDKNPADSRIIENNSLKVDEAPLTGESLPVEKISSRIENPETPLADRRNMLYMGTSVVYGRAKAIVVSTGMNTEFGQIANLLENTETRKTPLQNSLDKLGKQLGIFAIILSVIVSAFELFRGVPLVDVFVWGVALAVAIIPEALPAVVTITLALGVKRMVKRKALIRKLPAVETLGATNIICSDKTGTLTQDEMTIRRVFTNDKLFTVTGSGYKPEGGIYLGEIHLKPKLINELDFMIHLGVLNNDTILTKEEESWELIGDPTEGSIIVLAKKFGMDTDKIREKYTRIHEIPFSSDTKRMTTINRYQEKVISISKGAPEVIIENCEYYLKDGLPEKLTDDKKNHFIEKANMLGDEALRVIAISCKELDHDNNFDNTVESKMVFVGLVGMIDPPRTEAKEAIKLCEAAGIKPVMITGDNKITAMAVARELGILKNGLAFSGVELEKLSEEEFHEIVDKTDVFARISPTHKLKIVEGLIKKGNIVAMTGDGVNDAPSLKKADIGVAMGITGTDVSKEASDMILTDDNFASIVSAIEEGRSIFENIRKYLVFLLSGNMGTVFALIACLILGYAAPLFAVHILFINFIMDGIMAITLGLEPPEKGIMSKKPRSSSEGILNKQSLWYIGLSGIWIAFVTVFIYANYGHCSDYNLTDKTNEFAITMFFTSLIIARLFNAISCRSLNNSVSSYGLSGNKVLIYGILATLALSVMIIYLEPMNSIFSTVSIDFMDWIVVIAGGISVILFSEVFKFVNKTFFKK